MKSKYTRKHIMEAIAYWNKQLRKLVAESTGIDEGQGQPPRDYANNVIVALDNVKKGIRNARRFGGDAYEGLYMALLMAKDAIGDCGGVQLEPKPISNYDSHLLDQLRDLVDEMQSSLTTRSSRPAMQVIAQLNALLDRFAQ